MRTRGYLRLLAAAWLSAMVLLASEHHGIVTLGGLPVPGVTVTATRDGKTVTTLTDGMGSYFFPDLADGIWTIQVEMSGFSTLKRDVTVAPGAPGSTWELKIQSLSEIQAQIQSPALESRPAASAAAPASAGSNQIPAAAGKAKPQIQAPAGGNTPAQVPPGEAAAPSDEQSQRAADGFLVNGSQLNGGSTPFALNPAFGNNRRGPGSLYTYNLSFNINNSVLNARPFSQTGQNTPKAPYNNFTLQGSVQGPLRIPHLLRNGPIFFVNYAILRARNASTGTGLVPTAAERGGDLSSFAGQILDPDTLLPFPGNQIPPSRISPQATALLSLYPLPNFSGSSAFNYQIPLVGTSNTDNLNVRMNKQIGRKNVILGMFSFSSTRSSTPNLFNFLDSASGLGMNIDPVWRHQFTARFSSTLEFQFTRNAQHQYSYFENRENVSGAAGILGNNQEPLYWGPPTLNFGSSLITPLSDGLPSFYRPQTGILKSDSTWNHGRHNITFGADLRRQEFNYLSQTNPRGAFSFTGAATGPSGSPFADFLLGIPDASALAFGNADKYLRASGYDAYIQDDWRVNSALTINGGVRWEYNGPVSELYGRLVNLDVAPGFTAIAPVTGSDPTGALSGQTYPSSLIRPERYPFEPGLGIAWRPISGSSLVVRSGYSLRYSPSVYSGLAVAMDQQAPFSQSLQVANGPASPLTLANGFAGSAQYSPYTFGVDPNFKEPYVQTWYFRLQKDLPAGMQMQVDYTGTKGTRLSQTFYPNSYAVGAADPCPSCPAGFEYETSNANLTRHAGTIQLRRRLHSGFTAQAMYTYSKSIDDAGGPAQNWLDLSSERGLSASDQRHLAQMQLQYTSGMGIGGGNFISGWKAAVLKEWTILIPIRWGSGLPETPLYSMVLPGTDATTVLRPSFTGASLYSAPTGLFLNPAAFAQPLAGQFGNAAIDSITGPSQFSLNASLQRTFRVSDRVTLNLRVDSINILNHVVFGTYGTTLGSSQFGVASNANAMRSMSTTAQFRF